MKRTLSNLNNFNVEKSFNLEMINQMKKSGNFPTIEEIEANISEMEKNNMFTENELRKAFHIYDEDKDGSISYNELKNIIDLVGENMTESELNEFIREGDYNLTGDLNYNEIINLILDK